MLAQIAQLLVDVVGDFFVFMLLARFHFQWLRAPFRNPLGEFVVAVTNWAVRPARRVVPALAGFDLATLACAWLLQGVSLYLAYSLRGYEFGSSPGIGAGMLAAVALVDLLRYSLYILIAAVFVQAALSWVNPYSPAAPVLDALTRRFLRPFRRLLPPVANVDLSSLVLLLALYVALIPVAHLRVLVAGVL
jgi:YggT family protein